MCCGTCVSGERRSSLRLNLSAALTSLASCKGNERIPQFIVFVSDLVSEIILEA